MEDILLLSFLAALFCLDITAFGQFMISRPIVCAPLFGYLLGDIRTALWVGMIVELMWVSFIPMGAAIPQDNTSVAILATIWGLKSFPGSEAALMLALVFAAPVGILYRKTDIWVRYFNVRIAHWVEREVAAGREESISQGLYTGIFLFFIKGMIFYLVLIYPGTLLMRTVFPLLNSSIKDGLVAAWYLLPVAGLALLLVSFRRGKFPVNRIGADK